MCNTSSGRFKRRSLVIGIAMVLRRARSKERFMATILIVARKATRQ